MLLCYLKVISFSLNYTRMLIGENIGIYFLFEVTQLSFQRVLKPPLCRIPGEPKALSADTHTIYDIE